MRKNVGLFIILVSMFLMGTAPAQAAETFTMPWWGWLIIITVVLVLMMAITLGLDFGSVSENEDD